MQWLIRGKNLQKLTLERYLKATNLNLSILSQPYKLNGNRRTQRHAFTKLLLSPPPFYNPLLYFKAIHAQTVKFGFGSNPFINNILISVYSKSSCLLYAYTLFDKMPERTLITFSSVISMYSRHGYDEEALNVFLELRKSCTENPNEFVLASVIGCCAHLGSVERGLQLHNFVLKAGYDQYVYVGTVLIDFYLRVGDVKAAKFVFDGLFMKSVVTYTTIITGLGKCGNKALALELFREMGGSDVVPDKYVISSLLNVCSMLEFLKGGKEIHAYLLRRGSELMDVSVSNVLIDFYVKCGKVWMARKVFDQMKMKDVISWTAMISGYMHCSFDWEAMMLFAKMNQLGWELDSFACSSVLTSCGSLEALEQGRQVHAYIMKANINFDNFVMNSLIDMYSKCNSMVDARRVFDATLKRDIISYNAIIEGYSRQEKLLEALDLFTEMRLNFSPSLLTFVSLLGISASSLTLELGKQLHGLIIKFGFSLDMFAGSALIDVYAKCASTQDARLIFEDMHEKDVVMWNAMLFGYIQQSENEEVFRLYFVLQHSSKKPNESTFVALITASSNLASLLHGLQFHSQLLKRGLEDDPFVKNALVDMYAKCGSFKEARKMFDSTVWRDVACWNSMILTYAHHGEAEEALNMFEFMIKEGIKPNYVTFVGLLSACAHAGLVEEGFRHFKAMGSWGIEPGTEHFACIVSLLGRAGRLYEAKDFIETMPIQPAAIVWRNLLSACRNTGDVELGEHAAEMAISIDPKDSGSYILLSNIFASKGMWKNVKEVREKMGSSGVVKEPGCSWIEINDEVRSFVARDRAHSDADLVYAIMEHLDQHMKGYVPTSMLSVDWHYQL